MPTRLPTRLPAYLPTYLCQCLIQFGGGVSPIEFDWSNRLWCLQAGCSNGRRLVLVTTVCSGTVVWFWRWSSGSGDGCLVLATVVWFWRRSSAGCRSGASIDREDVGIRLLGLKLCALLIFYIGGWRDFKELRPHGWSCLIGQIPAKRFPRKSHHMISLRACLPTPSLKPSQRYRYIHCI